MGSVISAIGRGINGIIAAIASILEAIVSGITMVLATIFDIIGDILCCRCFRRRRGIRGRF